MKDIVSFRRMIDSYDKSLALVSRRIKELRASEKQRAHSTDID